jgi:nickel-dependent lactate racemase
LEVPAEALVADCSVARGAPLSDPAAAVAAALDDPLDFPPLRRATVPGDRIAIALEAGLPQADSIVAGIVHTLLQGSAQPQDIALVVAAGDADQSREEVARELVRSLPEELRPAVDVVLHDPTDKNRLAYLAASSDGKPIYMNRTLCDADVVIPVGMLRMEDSLGYVGVHGALFPAFSDELTQQRFRAPSSSNWNALRRRRAEEADEAAWMLGCQFSIQVVPGPGQTLLHVLVGDSGAVERRGRELCAAAWQFESSRRAQLVLVSIEGGPEQQTWENFARALFAASQVVDDDGAIVLCTALARRPGPALRQLASTHDDQVVLHELMREKTPDAVPAKLLVELRDKVRVYLLSELPGEDVESLGLGYVESAGDVERLRRQFNSCIVLGNAHRAWIRTPAEPQNA